MLQNVYEVLCKFGQHVSKEACFITLHCQASQSDSLFYRAWDSAFQNIFL